MIIRYFLLLGLFTFLSCGLPVAAGTRGDSNTAATTGEMAALKSEILQLINEYRKEKRLSPLVQNNITGRIADEHSANMARGKTAFGHDGFEQRNAELKKEIAGMSAMAENVAFGKLSAERVVNLWLRSSGHRRNIEGDYSQTGIGIARAADGNLYFTQIFIR